MVLGSKNPLRNYEWQKKVAEGLYFIPGGFKALRGLVALQTHEELGLS